LESLEPAVVVSHISRRVCATEKKRPQISPLRCAPVEMTIPFEGQVKRFQDKYEIFAATELSSRPEESWACGPPKVMKNASDRHPLSREPFPFPCHPDRSEAERRDLRFRGPFVEMFFDRAQRSEEPAPACRGICGLFYTPSLLPLSHSPKPFPLTNCEIPRT
jgi:hypothetical protein